MGDLSFIGKNPLILPWGSKKNSGMHQKNGHRSAILFDRITWIVFHPLDERGIYHVYPAVLSSYFFGEGRASDRYGRDNLGRDKHPGHERCIDRGPQVDLSRELKKPGGYRGGYD